MKHELKIKPNYLADATRQCGVMAELLRDIHEYIGASIPQTISEHYQGCDLLDRIDAVLTGKLPDHIADVSKMVAPEGWQLVPVEPTKAMREAFHEAHEEWESWNDWRLDSPDHQWHAMLAAAPKHQGGESCATEPPLSSKA